MRGKKFVKEREEAVELRKRGFSIVKIERILGINRSTLFGWLKDIKLSARQKERLLKHRREGLLRARLKAVKWHNAQKKKRLEFADFEARKTFNQLSFQNDAILELALAMLYWGEGFKNSVETGLGNSDPVMLSVFVKILRTQYGVPPEKIRCELYLRADQNVNEMKRFWSKNLSLPLENFRYTSLDQRTLGSKTFAAYKGVCSVRCGNVAIQRKLGNISKLFAEYILKRA